MNKKIVILFIIIIILIGVCYFFLNLGKEKEVSKNSQFENIVVENEIEIASYDFKETETEKETATKIETDTDTEVNADRDTEAEVEELEIIDLGNNTYEFEYNNEIFTAIYTEDNWKIIDSYKIDNTDDIMIICQKLINIHPVHGEDMVSYRTAEDMTFEWVQHNLAYKFLPEGNTWKESAKDVDLNPADQGKTADEIYKSRTGKDLNMSDLLK